MGSTIIEQDFPYDIIGRGTSDERRHNKRVKEATRKQLSDIIADEDIITSEGNKKIKVRLKYLNLPVFDHYRDRMDEVGRDEYDELNENEVLHKPDPNSDGGKPNKAGDEDGGEVYEAEYTVEELTEMMMEELELPDLDDTKKNELVSESIDWTDRRKSVGPQARLDKKKTILANIRRKRALKLGKKDKAPLIRDDMRFKTWDITQEKHSNAVVFLLMDRSGSMWKSKIYCVKALYFWIVQFLKRKYDKVEIRFIAHDYNARELKEKEFFTISDSGGTRVSSAYEMCKDIIEHRYSKEQWNIYVFHASDGDSWDDELECVELAKEIIKLGAILFAYSEIDIDSWRDGASDLKKLMDDEVEKQHQILTSVIEGPQDVLKTLKRFLRHSLRTAMEA